MPEKRADVGGDTVPGAQSGVPVADNVHVSFQHAIPDFSGVPEFRAEAAVRTKIVECRAGGDQLHVGGRDHAPALIQAHQGASVTVDGQGAPHGVLEHTAVGLAVHILLGRGLRTGVYEDQESAKEGCDFFHQRTV